MKTEIHLDEKTAPGSVSRVMQEANRGDKTAENLLWERLRPMLEKWAQARLAKDRVGQVIEPSDLVQEVWLKVQKKGGYPFENRKALYKFLSLVLHNIIVDVARKEFGGNKEALKQALIESMASDEARFQTMLTEDTFAFSEAFEMLRSAKPDYAELLLYKYGLGLTNNEIAEMVGKSVSTVKRDLTEQLKWARSFLEMFYADARSGSKQRP